MKVRVRDTSFETRQHGLVRSERSCTLWCTSVMVTFFINPVQGFGVEINLLCFWIIYLCRRKSSQTMEKYETRYFSITTMFFFCTGRWFRITTDSLNSGTLEEIYEECHHCGYARKDPALFGSQKHRHIWFCLVSGKRRSQGFRDTSLKVNNFTYGLVRSEWSCALWCIFVMVPFFINLV